MQIISLNSGYCLFENKIYKMENSQRDSFDKCQCTTASECFELKNINEFTCVPIVEAKLSTGKCSSGNQNFSSCLIFTSCFKINKYSF